jgi:hypothetical protein
MGTPQSWTANRGKKMVESRRYLAQGCARARQPIRKRGES